MLRDDAASTSAPRLPGIRSLGLRARLVVSDAARPRVRRSAAQLPAPRTHLPVRSTHSRLRAELRFPCHQSVARPMSHSPREHRTVSRAMNHLTAVLHRPIESHDGTCLATRLWLVAQTFDASFACHHIVSVQWPLAAVRRMVAHPPARFPACRTRSFLRVQPASAHPSHLAALRARSRTLIPQSPAR